MTAGTTTTPNIGGQQKVRPGLRLLRLFANSRELTLGILVLTLVVVMSIAFPLNFPTGANIRAVLLNLAPVGIMVCGMMLLMIAGTFDLSCGSTLALSGVAAGVVVGWWGWPPQMGVVVGITVGALCGVVNGLIVTAIGINALIATLGTLAIFRGMTYVLAGTGVTPISDAFAYYGQATDPVFGIQSLFWVMLIVALIIGFLISQTPFFRQYYFIGGNARAAKLSGIRVNRMLMLGFTLMGVLSGLAGVLYAARLNSAVVNAGVGIELKVITATVLGGASLKGGEGRILGGILGVLFIALVENAMIINRVGVFWQGIVIGLVLLFAVSLDRFKNNQRG